MDAKAASVAGQFFLVFGNDTLPVTVQSIALLSFEACKASPSISLRQPT
jgi:hypothetical protein